MRGMLRSMVRAGGGLVAAMLLVGTVHADFVNGGFESGSFGSEWIRTPLRNNGVPTAGTHAINPKSIKDLNLRANAADPGYDANLYTTTGTAPDSTDMSVILDAGGAGKRTQQDPLLNGSTPAATLRWPFAGNYSALVNLDPIGAAAADRHIARSGSPNLGSPAVQYTGHGARASSIRQRAQVLASDVDPDGKVHIRFAMTPVLDNPGLIKKLSGTVTATNSSAVVTGTGTNFLSTVAVGNYVRLGTNATDRLVTAVNSDTQITLSANAINVTGGDVYVSKVTNGHYPEEQPYFAVEVRKITSGTDATPVAVPGAPVSSPGQLFFTFNFSNQPGTVWHDVTNNSRNYAYSEFITFDIAPGNAKLQVGDWIELELVAAGCSPGGHEGHVHVDSFSFKLPDELWVSVSGPTSVSNANGTQITYTYTYTNRTSDPVNNVTIKPVMPQDNTAVPQDSTFVSSSGGNCTPDTGGATGLPPTPGGSLSCNVGTVPPGGTGTFTVTITIPDGATGPINNGDYTIQGDSIGPLAGPMWKTDLVAPATLSDMQVNASGLPGTATVGTNYSGSYTCSNAGVADATVATCDAANLPAGVSVTACTISPATAPWTQPANVPAGETVTCQVSGLPTTQGTTTVSVSTGADNDPDTTNNNASVPIVIAAAAAAPDMQVNLAGLPSIAVIGAPYSGSFTCTNAGAIAAPANASTRCEISNLPAGIAQGACTVSPSGAAWAQGSAVPVGAVVSCAVSGTPSAGAVSSTVTGTTGTPGDSNPLNNTATASITLQATAPDVRVDLSGLPATANVGVPYSGSFTCTNGGSAIAVTGTSCDITGGLPPGVTVTPGSCTIGGSAWAPNSPIPIGQTVTCQVSGTPTAVGTTTAHGSTSATNDPNLFNNTQDRSIAVAAAGGAAAIPTLSEWGLLILSVLMGVFMVGMQRRRMH